MTSERKITLLEAIDRAMGQAPMAQVDFTEMVSVTIVCKFCGSDKVIKYGSKAGQQRYYCQSCKRVFIANNALEGMRYPPDQIASALQAFYEGQSLRAVQRQLGTTYGIMPSDSTVYEWVKRFTKKARRRRVASGTCRERLDG